MTSSLDPTQTSSPPAASATLDALTSLLDEIGPRVIACSGGIDSLVLATIAHQQAPDLTTVAHTVTPAVPSAGTARVLAHARRNGWKLELVTSNEFSDERYLSNPTDRCYFCKTNLYDAVAALVEGDLGDATVLSGANIDDLGEYRPGLIAADEHDVRHPYVEANIDKAGIRSLAADLGLAEADLPASPCLASRLYTGTRVTAERLRSIELGEAVLSEAGFAVNRCRMRGDEVLVELPEPERERCGNDLLDDVASAMRTVLPTIASVALDTRPYRSGQAILGLA